MGKIFIGSKIIPKNTAKRLIRCCSCHKYYDFKGNIFSSIEGRILICPHCGLKHKIDFVLFDKKIEKLKRIDKLVLAAIDIGNEAIVRDGGYSSIRKTVVNKGNPANESGTITKVEVWVTVDAPNAEIGIFYVVSGNRLSTRDNVAIGTVTAGGKRTFNVNLTVQAGDYIGFTADNCYVYVNTSGGSGVWGKLGDYIPCTNVLFSPYDGYVVSLYGYSEEAEVKNATGKSSISTSVISTLSRGKIESISAKAPLISNIIGILSRGKVESISGKSDITTLIDSLLSRGRIESVNGKVDIASLIISILSKGKIEIVSGMASINTTIDAILNRGIIENVNGISSITSNVSTILSKGIIQNVSGKSSFDSVINITLSKGKVESASGKADIPSDVIIVLNRGIIEDTSGTASIMTSMISLLSKGRIEDVSGKSQFDTNVDAVLKRIISVNSKAILETLCDIIINKGEIADVNGKVYIYTSIKGRLTRELEVSGKVDINSLINISLKRLLNANGKSIFDTLIEIEVLEEFAFTQATLGITTTGSKFDITNVIMKFGIKE